MQVPYEQTEQPLISAAHGKLHEISVSRLMTDVLAFHIFPVLRSAPLPVSPTPIANFGTDKRAPAKR